jgi:alcohol dehydrogenase
LTAGLVHTSTIPELIKKVMANEINPKALVSHHFKLSEMMQGYSTFKNAKDTGAIKIIFQNDL